MSEIHCLDCERSMTDSEWRLYLGGRRDAIIMDGFRLEWHCGCGGREQSMRLLGRIDVDPSPTGGDRP